jgi:hypothetical protein
VHCYNSVEEPGLLRKRDFQDCIGSLEQKMWHSLFSSCQPNHKRCLPLAASFRTSSLALFLVPLKISSSTNCIYDLAEHGKHGMWTHWPKGAVTSLVQITIFNANDLLLATVIITLLSHSKHFCRIKAFVTDCREVWFTTTNPFWNEVD